MAKELHQPSPRAMLKQMSIIEFNNWRILASFAPWGDERADIHAAQICQMIVNMQRDTEKHPNPIPLQDFILKFDETRQAKPKDKPQTVDEIFKTISDWVAGSNQVMEEKKRHGL